MALDPQIAEILSDLTAPPRRGHTPGPWLVGLPRIGGSDNLVDIYSPTRGALAAVVVRREEDPNRAFMKEGLANADLIAAAPEMLAVLEDTLSWMLAKGVFCRCPDPSCRSNRLLAVVRRATGVYAEPEGV